MQDFLMLFHTTDDPAQQPSGDELQAMLERWENWIGGLAAQGKFKGSEALQPGGRMVAADGSATDGPFTEIKEMINGYAVVTAADYDEAVRLTVGCPIFEEGGRIEVRAIMYFN